MTDYNIQFQRHPDLVSANLDELVVLLSVKSGKYFQMNAVGSHIWTLLETPKTVGELNKMLLEAFDVPKSKCSEQVSEFLDYLINRDLIEQIE